MADKNEHIPFGEGDRSAAEPPGKLKLMEALKSLLENKDFNSITTAEIAKTAQTNEALIYWHFQDKRGLLHEVLEEYLREHKALIDSELKKIKGAMNKLKKAVSLSFYVWNKNRIYAKIILIEVRSFPGYFKSHGYEIVRSYSNTVKEIFNEGIKSGEFRDDLQPSILQDILLGSIEHHMLPAIIFGREFDAAKHTDQVCKVFFEGIKLRNGTSGTIEEKKSA